MNVVYFIRAGARGPIKIGSTSDLGKRLASLQTASPQRLQLVGAIPGGAELERAIHARLSEFRISGGEWFGPAPEVRRWAQMAAVIDGRYPVEVDGETLRDDVHARFRRLRLFSGGLRDRSPRSENSVPSESTNLQEGSCA